MGYTIKYDSFPSDRKTAMTNAYNNIILPNEGYEVLQITGVLYLLQGNLTP